MQFRLNDTAETMLDAQIVTRLCQPGSLLRSARLGHPFHQGSASPLLHLCHKLRNQLPQPVAARLGSTRRPLRLATVPRPPRGVFAAYMQVGIACITAQMGAGNLWYCKQLASGWPWGESSLQRKYHTTAPVSSCRVPAGGLP